jgi:uncharacterized membrane protein
MVERGIVVFCALALSACTSGDGGASVPGDTSDTAPFDLIGVGDVVHFTGTEPFWGGQVQGSALTYTTPENIEGARISVARFAGRGGVSFSGTLEGLQFDMAVSEGGCSDGMSDRNYPFNVTLRIGEEMRSGCAWTDAIPFEGDESP